MLRVARHNEGERKVFWALWVRHHVTYRTKRKKHLLFSFRRARVRHFHPVQGQGQFNFLRRVHAEVFERFSLLFLILFDAFSQVLWSQRWVHHGRTKISHVEIVILLFYDFPRAVDDIVRGSRANRGCSREVRMRFISVSFRVEFFVFLRMRADDMGHGR